MGNRFNLAHGLANNNLSGKELKEALANSVVVKWSEDIKRQQARDAKAQRRKGGK